MEKENKKPSKKVKIIGNTIFFSIITLMVTFFVWNFIDIKSGYRFPIFGLRTSVIVSPSMATVNEANTYITSEMSQIKPYDTVTTVTYKNYEEIELYDIATYFTGSKSLICHRVVNKYEENGKKYVVLRGDANSTDDAPVSYDLIRGKVIKISRGTGHFVAFVQSPFFFIAIFGTIFFVALGIFIMDRNKEKKEALEEVKETNDSTSVEENKVDEPIEPEKDEINVEEKNKEIPQEDIKEKVEEATSSEEKSPVKRRAKKKTKDNE